MAETFMCDLCHEYFSISFVKFMQIPMICEDGRALVERQFCPACVTIMESENQEKFNSNNKIQDFLGQVDIEVDPFVFLRMPQDLVRYFNEESDAIFPLFPGRVASEVPDSLEAWCRTSKEVK